MAFFRNFGNEMESGNDLNEKGGDIEAEEDYISAGNNRQMDLNFAENDAEMKLDNHYEQDGEEQSDSLLGRGRSITSISGSRLPPRPVPVTENAAKSSKATKYDEYDDFEDYEENDEEEEDGPDDVDFEPDFGDTCKSIKNKEFANVNGKLTKGKGSRKNAKVEAENLIISNSRSKYGNLKSGFPKLNSRTKKESLQKHQSGASGQRR